MREVDLTPTWQGMMPAMRLMIESGTPESASIAWQEIERMAKIADRYIATQKENAA